MKKISTVFFTMLLVFSTLSISSCKKEVVPYFIYEPNAEYGGREEIACFKNGHKKEFKEFFEDFFEGYDQYDDFVAFYETELMQNRGEHFYFLEPGFEALYGWFYHDRIFTVYADPTGALPTLLVKNIDVYDPDYVAPGYIREPSYDSDVSRTVNMVYMTAAVPDKIKKNTYRLQFGEKEDGPWNTNRFINIYVGRFCVATCYYREFLPVTQEWFENYFRNNLSKR